MNITGGRYATLNMHQQQHTQQYQQQHSQHHQQQHAQHAQHPQQAPYVFILDLDGTIIGDCSYQCDVYNIQEIIRGALVTNKQQMNKMQLGAITRQKTICDKSLNECYKACSKLIRPFFGVFINKMKKQYPNSYFFVYTASEKSWAVKEIGIIEKQNNMKFNRPLFTRDDCIIDSSGNIKKSVAKIMPAILKSIRAPKTFDIKNNLLIIDNNPTFIDYKDNLLICPTYNYLQFQNLWDNIPHDYQKIAELKSFVSKLISSKKIYARHHNANAQMLERIHRWLYRKYKRVNKYNATFENDTFWKDIASAIEQHNIKVFNKRIVTALAKAIKK